MTNISEYKTAIFGTVVDQSDAVPLCPRLHLFLKPYARILITVQLSGKNKTSISNWQVMERLKECIDPDKLSYISVAKTSSSEIMKFDAELNDCSRLSFVLSRLCDRRIKIPGVSQLLTVHAIETKPDFPTRHDWDSFFRDRKDMDEMKPGERPDTIHIENIPLEWLTELNEKHPSENSLKKMFNKFGEVARVDLPAADPSRVNHGLGICDAYIQFREYSAFSKAMDALKASKLAYITETKALTANIKVDFDKTKHMSLNLIMKRLERRDLFMMRQKIVEETERVNKEKERRIAEEENKKKQLEMEKKLERRKLRENKRKARRLKRLADQEVDEMNERIVSEEKLLLKTQRKLEALHLLSELFTRVKINVISKRNEVNKSQTNSSRTDTNQLGDIESTFRQKMIKQWKPYQSKTYSVNVNKDLENSNNNDENVNNNRDRGRSNSWRGLGGHQCKLNQVDSERSKKRKRSISHRSYRSYSRSRSHNRNHSKSKSRSRTRSRSTKSRSCSRSKSHSRSRRHSRSKSLIKTTKSRSNSKSPNKNRYKSIEKSTENGSGHKHKKKSKKKKTKKHKKSKN